MSGWPSGQFGGGLVDADKLLSAPLPNGRTNPIMVAAPEDHAPVVRGGLATFLHLFDVAMGADLGGPTMLTADEPVDSRARLNNRLSTVLNTTEGKLPADVGQVGQELAFHLATDPILYRRFANAISPLDSRAFEAEHAPSRETPTSPDRNVEEVRQRLLTKGVSPTLGAKLVKR